MPWRFNTLLTRNRTPEGIGSLQMNVWLPERSADCVDKHETSLGNRLRYVPLRPYAHARETVREHPGLVQFASPTLQQTLVQNGLADLRSVVRRVEHVPQRHAGRYVWTTQLVGNDGRLVRVYVKL